MPGDLQGNIRRELGKSMQYEAAMEAQARALDKRFTRPELDTAARFYGSPLGQKMLEQLPDAQGEVGEQLQAQLAMVVPDILHRVAPDALSEAGAEGSGSSDDLAAEPAQPAEPPTGGQPSHGPTASGKGP
ncbi:MAG TPA: DUF2059 domain-containing protein [Anaeromyxobacter sp.]|nr:DUF2059 domain-containing protein [Anaeromyxobacter sp.]